MNKNPSTTFFWNDLENDEKLKTCSLAAKGLWDHHMLPMAARSPEHGVVILGEHPSRLADDLPLLLARAVGETPDVIAGLLRELVTSGAASVDDQGRVYNRRMVREEAIRRARSEAGKKGAAAKKAANLGGWQDASKYPDKQGGKHPSKQGGKTEGGADGLSHDTETKIQHEGHEVSQQNVSKTTGNTSGKPQASSFFSSSRLLDEEDDGESLTEVTARASNGAPTPRGTRLPVDWRPSDELRQWTIKTIREAEAGVSAGRELEKFRDHWKATAGAKGRKADWNAAWRNWIRKAIEMEGKPNGKQPTRHVSRKASDDHDAFAAGVSKALAGRSVPTG